MTNPTLHFPQDQPKKRQFGRIPVDLLSKIQTLSNQEAKVFLVLSMLANFKREPLGMVECQSLSDLAKTIGVPRKSFYRAIEGLTKCGLVTRPGRDTCVVVTHYLCHEDAPPVSLGHTPVSSCLTETAGAPKESTTCKAPIRSEEVSEEVTEAVAAGNGHKKPRRRPSWLIWNSDEEQLRSRPGKEFQERKDEFFKLWADRLGNEDALYEQLSEADKWLKRHPDRRGKVKRFDMFFGKWLDRCLEG